MLDYDLTHVLKNWGPKKREVLEKSKTYSPPLIIRESRYYSVYVSNLHTYVS